MSRSVRDPDYRHLPGTLHKCLECATLTPADWDPEYGYRCEKHVVITQPELLFCQEVHSEFVQH